MDRVFLGAIVNQADVNLEKVKNILILYEVKKQKFIEATRSQFAVPALDAFFMRPIINTTDFATHTGIENRVTANGIITQLHREGLIQRVRKGAGRTPSVFALPELINITEGRDVMPLVLGKNDSA